MVRFTLCGVMLAACSSVPELQFLDADSGGADAASGVDATTGPDAAADTSTTVTPDAGPDAAPTCKAKGDNCADKSECCSAKCQDSNGLKCQ